MKKRIIIYFMIVFLFLLFISCTSGDNCYSCRGTGRCRTCNGGNIVTCWTCHGEKMVWVEGSNPNIKEYVPCSTCSGTGMAIRYTCYSCNGRRRCAACNGTGKRPQNTIVDNNEENNFIFFNGQRNHIMNIHKTKIICRR